jgi:RNA-directed DNA polymerase
VNRQLERRGHCIARYADDCNAYLRGARAGQPGMPLRRQLYAGLRLAVNATRSAVARVFG